MKSVKIIILGLIIVAILAIGGSFLLFGRGDGTESDFHIKRDTILSELYLAIEKAQGSGNYNCCIEPPCTMCYLGDWLWGDGSCYCDREMAQENWDKVCPQCIKGIEQGKCKSNEDTCFVL